uniref:Acyl-CoA dehydrogenase/oxidase C-terminal domain-containing protein n=1 Tax=Aplanochytrium stocchinoi TaxID=215587 RepID=A0A7S3UYT2_9STRA|mmetsp:Transcript_13899/g.16131  ORF Transcript_13899/g.16131 Transcript_13899/m.16131 type:complete len:470 (-) Transcript_13899:288-1697(-)|eukprot:CAMPEP_0204825978 /NCGR_PEP_ID=MMETSP1346-20131115/3751_1 /ASSEMBLY_ACC=CAM_ASM_000771 /TAXON_ID=215587 /ORGANISM="Aplanochytrium stocchinoi, Strain GSBS06" /LENGTH=469 /DNA_ID=CAMNT_0051953799 /DNA_START=67 /DNA_END=1476 /DNA_ORIENTATION=-
MTTWREKFIQETQGISSDVSYEESAQILRDLVKSKMLKFTDIQNDPDRFFEAHRLLLAPATRGPGFGIRFTVQFNLFAGSIIGLGNPEQVAMLDTFADEGRLGCFCLTEKGAGVNSGLVVETTATWVPEKQKFLLHCPTPSSEKNWISQGLTASKAVVIANLIIAGKAYGPHGFIIDLRDGESGSSLPGISMTDMGKKTTGNDLDNASIKFTNVWLEKSALLSRFADIQNDKYVQTTKERMRLEVIGQRLLTGRLAIAQAGIIFAEKLFEETKKFADQRKVWAPKGAPDTFLSSLPHLKYLFAEADERLQRLTRFCDVVEKRLSKVLTDRSIPSADLVEAIGVCKVSSIEDSIELCHRLKQEVGSYGLMDGTGFEHVDFLQCCKFAEGDSRILSQKMARDTMKAFKSGNPLKDDNVKQACVNLAAGLASSKVNPLVAWNEQWKLVYKLAEAVRESHIREAVGPLNMSKL